MRGCKCATSIKADLKSLPSLSNSLVPCAAVRAGQLSRRRKTMMTTAAIMSARSVNAIGHENRPDSADFDMERWKLNVGRFLFTPKKVPPPTPDGREGRLFPPEQSWKTPLLVIELTGRRNKILRQLMRRTTRFVKNLSPNPPRRAAPSTEMGNWQLRAKRRSSPRRAD